MPDPEVIIVGGGLAGLCCGRRLHESGVSFRLLEAADRVGGRVRTDKVDGFLLDRGFQVLLTAYPEATKVLDYDALKLGRFEPGALVRLNGRFHRFVDPWRRPRHLLSTAFSPVASFSDKLRVARLRRDVCRGSLEQTYERPETTTIARLREQGFSDRIIEQFFRPFLGGVFLERGLQTSSRKFEFVFRMFAQGEAALPASGIAAIADQLAATLPQDSLQSHSPVERILQNEVILSTGEKLPAKRIVIACEQPAAARLLGQKMEVHAHSVTCLYFAADHPPIKEPILILNGEADGPVNNLCVPSQVCSAYAPPGQSLVSITVLPDSDGESLESRVRTQLRDWFGSQVESWRSLASYYVEYALPVQNPPALSPVEKPTELENGIFLCGDYLDTASIQGAMISGRRAAESVIRDLKC